MVFNLPEELEILLSDESNKFLKFAKKFSPVFLILAIFSALSVSAALVRNFDEEIGHFSRGSVWFYLLCAITVISVISSAVLAILSSKKISLYKEPGEDLFSLFASVLCALVSAAAFIFFLISLPGYSVSKNLLQILSGLLLVFLAAGVFISVFPKYKNSPARAVLMLFGCVAVNLDMFARYFDFTLPLNSPIRNLETIMQACALLFLLSEARLTLGAKDAHNTAKFYIFTSAAASSLSLGIGIGEIIFKISSPVAASGAMPIIRLALYASIGILAYARLAGIGRIAGKYVPSEKNVSADDSAEEN